MFRQAWTAFKSNRSYATYQRFNNGPARGGINFTAILSSRKTLYAAGGIGAFYIYNLDQAPFTHRRRFLWIPYWMELKIGDYSYRQIYAQYANQIVPTSDPLYAKVGGVMNKLLGVALSDNENVAQRDHLKSLLWNIHIINDNTNSPNAFILPNGKIFIFSSILPICKDEQGLATVLSHELSHQLAHHTSEQLSLQPFYIVLSTTLYALTGISWFNDLLIQGLLQMPSSREMESEADRIGCELMAKLCFSLPEAVHFWQRMQTFEGKAQSSGALLEFLLTHPATTKRIKDIESWMPELLSIQESSDCHEYKMFGEARNFFGKRL